MALQAVVWMVKIILFASFKYLELVLEVSGGIGWPLG
jgi:hypothetical protein